MKKKSFLATILALAMVLSLTAGCGETKTDTASTAETAQVSQAAQTAAATATPTEESVSAAESAEESAQEPEVLGPEAYYASEDNTQITVLFQYAAWFQGFFPEGWGKSEFWTQFGEATNTTWSLQEVANTAWTENVNLLCAAGDLPDVVMGLGSSYTGGLTAAMRDEQIVDLSSLIEKDAPHYYDILTSDDYTLKTCVNDDGQMGAMYPLTKTPDPIVDGLWIRQDWLDGVNMDVPTDPDSLYDVLQAFSTKYGATTGFFQMIRANDSTIGPAAEGIWNAFGPVNYYLDDSGTIQLSFMQDYYYDYLAYLQKLANAKLFLTSTMTDQKASSLFASNLIGVEGDSITNVPSYISLLSEADQAVIDLEPMAALGDPTEYGSIQSLVSGANSGGGQVSISCNCQNPDVVLKAFDYLFTDPGSILSIWGEEGVSFEYDANGDPQLTDLVMNNPDGIPVNAALGYWCNPGIPGLGDATRTQSTWTDAQKSASDIWAKAYSGSSATVDVDGLSLTETEQDAISGYKSDLKTYAEEWINNVIFNNGDLSDASIKEFQDYLTNTLHVDEILKIYNDAYKRFEARSL